MLKKLISGAQTGADQGGLIAAKKFGLETGGWIPKGFLTEDGFKTEFADLYGLIEVQRGGKSGYVARTYANAKMADGTIRFASNWNSPGELCTLKAIKKFDKPYIDIDVESPLPPEEVAKWLEENNIEILNVAGNRESKYLGLQKFVEEYLLKVFDINTTIKSSITPPGACS